MPAGRYRSWLAPLAAAAILGVPGAAGATAEPFDEGALPYVEAQHNGLEGHLPPVTQNLQPISKLELSGAFGDVVPGQIADVSVHKGWAYLSSWQVRGDTDEQCRGGWYVVDIRDPQRPREVAFHPALDGSYHTEGVHAIEVRTPQFSGDLLALSNEHQIGLPDPDCEPSDETQGGFDLWDVSNPEDPVPLVRGFGDPGVEEAEGPQRTNEAHSIFLWQDGAKAYAVSVDNEENTDVDVWDITDPRQPVQLGDWDLNEMFPQITSGLGFGESSFLHDMTVKRVNGVQTMLLSYWDGGYVALNVDDPANPAHLGDSDFDGEDPLLPGVEPPSGDAHYAEFSHDGKFILAADEDFSPYRFVPEITSGAYAGHVFPTGVADDPRAQIQPGEDLAGPTYFVGQACTPDSVAPAPSPDAIAVAERGACSFFVKSEAAEAGGYAGVIIMNNNTAGNGCETLLNMAFADFGYDGDLPSLFVRRSDGFRILGIYDPATHACEQGGAMTPAPAPGTQGSDVEVSNFFDGWGYTHLYRYREGKFPHVAAFAIPESLDARFAFGFGDLSVHEFATDPTEYLAYSAYYSGGMRVMAFGDGRFEQVGAFIDEGGSNFWGVEQFTGPDRQRYIAGSDRDYGLYLFRYTGPDAPQPPSCDDIAHWTRQGQATEIHLVCRDPNTQNTLTLSLDSGPTHGTLSAIDGSKVTYTPGADFRGVETFLYRAFDGAAFSSPAQVQVFVGGCAHRIDGTPGRDLINGTAAGDAIHGGGDHDTVEGLQSEDCLAGEDGRDQLSGGDGDDRLLGGGGGDRLFGEAFDDHLHGGAGADHLRGSSGDDEVYGEAGRDWVSGGSNDDRVSGGRGRDALRGNTGNDRLFGGPGPDSISTGPGIDKVSGGSGRDRINAVNGSRSIIRCGTGRDVVRADRKDRVAGDCEVVRRTRRTRG